MGFIDLVSIPMAGLAPFPMKEYLPRLMELKNGTTKLCCYEYWCAETTVLVC